MAHVSRPNSWVSQDTAATTQLTYGLQLNPAPLTVSISGEDPILGSLEFVLTNPTASAISVNSVAFTIQVGTEGSNLTTSTANVGTSVSDTTNWQIQSPGTITSGPAVYTLQPKTGTSVSVAAGASIVVEIIDFPTVENYGNTTINVKEIVGSTIGFNSFLVTTFPAGFYFNGLSATVLNGGNLTPVAQVATGAPVTLVWNSSVVQLTSFNIYYSNAAQGQQQATPSDTGIWTSPPLTADTVFTIIVTVTVPGGSPLTAALSTAVAVQNPSLIAASLTAVTATVNGPLTVTGNTQANAITATGLTVNGTLNAADQSNLGTVAISNTATIGTSLRINGTSTGTAFSLGGAGVFNVDAPSSTGGRFTVQNNGAVGINRPNPGSTLDINGNLAVSSGANISGPTYINNGFTVTGSVSMCPAADESQGVVAIGGTFYGNVKLMLTNSDPKGFGIYVNSSASSNPYWGLCVIGPCINSSGSWSQISDLALKERIQPYQEGVDTLLKINPVRFYYKGEMGINLRDEQIGVVAQELREVAPYMVGKIRLNPGSEEEYLTIDNGAITYMLINAVKELHAEIGMLKAELKTLKDN